MMLKPLAGLFAGALALFAQADMQVYSASLAAASPVAGKLVLFKDVLAFVDDQRPESSFAVPRSNIAGLTHEDGAVTVQLRAPVRDRTGDVMRVILRLASAADGSAVQRWHGADEGAAGAQAAGAAAAADGALSFRAQRKKRLRGNTDGRLLVDHERVIFESADNASESRRWELKEIKEFKLKNPYELEVLTFRGEKYNLALSGSGMDNKEYREIVDRVTRARTAR